MESLCPQNLSLGATLGAVLGVIGLRIVLWGRDAPDRLPTTLLFTCDHCVAKSDRDGRVWHHCWQHAAFPPPTLRIDPATSSSQPVATLIDVTGLITISQPHVWCFAACCCENRAEGKKEIRANHCWSSSSPGTKRYPTHGSVRMYLRELTSCSSFLRSWPMKTRR